MDRDTFLESIENMTSVEEIDEFLDQEHVEATDEVEETVQDEGEQEQEQEQTTTETPEIETPPATPEVQVPVDTHIPDPTNQDFARMRIERKQYERRAQELETLLENMSSTAGFENTEEFLGAFNKAREAEEQEALGYDDVAYQKHKELAVREQQLNQQQEAIQQAEVATKVQSLGYEIMSIAEQTGISPQVIEERLNATGFTPFELVEGNYDTNSFIRNAILEDIIEAEVTRRTGTIEKPAVDTDSFVGQTASTPGQLDIDDLIKRELADYAKQFNN